MTFEITQRDKKLLMGLAVVVLIVGLGFGILYPLINKAGSLNEELDAAQYEKQEKEVKMSMLPELEKKEEEIADSLASMKEKFYENMTSMDVDKMLTKRALENNLTVANLAISMPATGEMASLMNYKDMLNLMLAQSTEVPEARTFEGVSAAQVTMNLTGTRENLQKMLDECIQDGPKLRVDSYNWQTSSLKDTETYGLNLAMELYMAEDTESFMNRKLEEEAQAAAEGAADTEPAE